VVGSTELDIETFFDQVEDVFCSLPRYVWGDQWYSRELELERELTNLVHENENEN